MNIYIYGSSSFKKEIRKVLNRSNVKFRLDQNGVVEEIDSLEALKLTIEDSPGDIYLIDNDKIIKKNIISEKIGFLNPKDGIEQEFLDEHGIGDISVNELEEIPKYIIKRLESLYPEEDEDIKEIQEEEPAASEVLPDQEAKEEELDVSVSNEEREEIDDIVSSIEENIDEEDDLGLDDELSSLLSADLDENEEIDEIKEFNVEVTEEKEIDMGSEFSELDSLNESDIIAALDGIDSIDAGSIAPPKPPAGKPASASAAGSTSEIELSEANANDLASLINQLLNNKTLEITIKVKN